MKCRIIHVIFCIIYFNLFCYNISAQTQKGQFFLGGNFVHLLHKQAPAIDLSFAYAVSDKFAIKASGGPVVNLYHVEDLHVKKVSGWQAGLGLRYNCFKTSQDFYSIFVESRVKHKSYQPTIAGDFTVTDSYGRYKKRINYTVDVYEWNLQAGIGHALQFDQFRMELFLGLGLADVDLNYGNIPSTATFKTNGAYLWEPDMDYEIYPDHLFAVEFTMGYLFSCDE